MQRRVVHRRQYGDQRLVRHGEAAAKRRSTAGARPSLEPARRRGRRSGDRSKPRERPSPSECGPDATTPSFREMLDAGTLAGPVRVRPGCPRAKSAVGSEPDQSVRWVPASSMTATQARSAPPASRQSWGSSLTRVENVTSPASRSGIVTTEPADCTSARPFTPSGSTDQCASVEPSSSFIRNADNGIVTDGRLPAGLVRTAEVRARTPSLSGSASIAGGASSTTCSPCLRSTTMFSSPFAADRLDVKRPELRLAVQHQLEQVRLRPDVKMDRVARRPPCGRLALAQAPPRGAAPPRDTPVARTPDSARREIARPPSS